ncbi:MAG TPA: hypothetical protein VH598_08660, partial [Verrucomicrobiae bacterium]|nr:hypothetical protein [Verrucomicrobiae bacterium]
IVTFYTTSTQACFKLYATIERPARAVLAGVARTALFHLAIARLGSTSLRPCVGPVVHAKNAGA